MLEQLRSPEKSRKLSQEKVVYLGRLAIRAEQLGINDPLTHLYQYLEKGETAEIGIRQDVETDIAERLPKTPFVNYVGFDFVGNDFASSKDKVSMDSMTKNNLKIISEEYAVNPTTMSQEYARAKIEAEEVERLVKWFKTAKIGSCQIFESLPIGNQKIAITRIYKKIDSKTLEGCFVSLYNPSVELFNQFRKQIDKNSPTLHTEIDILQNNYEFNDQKLLNGKNFVDFYVNTYDQLLQVKTGREFSFGIENDKEKQRQNGIKMVRSQPGLINTYVQTVKKLAESSGLATADLVDLTGKINTGHRLELSQNISAKIVHDILNTMIIGITSAIDKGDDTLLEDLNKPYSGADTDLATVSHFAEVASKSNQSYDSNGCPEFSRSSENTNANSTSNSETAVMQRAFGIEPETLKNFGKPKIDVCRINSCPSRGDIWWWPDKTLVGGCNICVHCHKLLEKGHNPDRVYVQREKERKAAEEELKKKNSKKSA